MTYPMFHGGTASSSPPISQKARTRASHSAIRKIEILTFTGVQLQPARGEPVPEIPALFHSWGDPRRQRLEEMVDDSDAKAASPFRAISEIDSAPHSDPHLACSPHSSHEVRKLAAPADRLILANRGRSFLPPSGKWRENAVGFVSWVQHRALSHSMRGNPRDRTFPMGTGLSLGAFPQSPKCFGRSRRRLVWPQSQSQMSAQPSDGSAASMSLRCQSS